MLFVLHCHSFSDSTQLYSSQPRSGLFSASIKIQFTFLAAAESTAASVRPPTPSPPRPK